MGRLAGKWLEFRDSRDPAGWRLWLGLVVVAALLGIYLIAGPSPWENSILKRLAAGKELKLGQFITVGLWWGAAVSLGAAIFALATAKWWSRPTSPVFPDLRPQSKRLTRWTWIFAVAAMALAAWPRASRLDHSLWNDEEYHLRTYVLGNWQAEGPGGDTESPSAPPLKFEPISWTEAVFKNEKGNNHIWSSIEVRLGHLLGGRSLADGKGFSESSLRLFPFTSGILTVGFMVLLGTALGGPRLGLAAGLILALHPWHVRWSVEIRGYSTMLLAITAGLYCLVRALQSNRWRWWLGYAVCQTLFLLCFAGSVYVAAAQNLVALAVIGFSSAPRAVRLGTASRLITAGIVSLIPAALIFGPHVPQLAAYLKSAHDYAPVNASWFYDLWTHAVTGLRPDGDPAGTSLGLAVSDLTAGAPWRKWLIYGAIPVLCVIGLAALARRDWRTRLIAGTLFLAGLLAIIHNASSGTAFLTWYLLYLLPLFVLALVWGAAALASLRPAALGSLPLMAAALFSVLTSPALARIMNVPRQPIRETVALMRGSSPALQEAAPGILTASLADGARQMLSYDPRLQILKTPEDLAGLIRTSADSSRTLFLCIRGPAAISRDHPGLLAAVTSDPRWERLSPVLGMEAMLSYDVYRFSPGGMERVELIPPPATIPSRPAPPPPQPD